jgi:pimeloyl-ACP methyl ester carboxylesterase
VTEGWIERAGTRLHWQEWRPEGAAREPAVLLLGGPATAARPWDGVAERLPDRRVVVLDLPRAALDDLVAGAGDAAGELGLGRPLVAGRSWAAAVALALADDRPELASGLVFVDGAAASLSRLMTREEAAPLLEPADPEVLRELFDFQPELLFANVEGPILLATTGAPDELRQRLRRSIDEVVELRPDAQVRGYESSSDVPGELAADVERTAVAAEFRSIAREAAALTARPRFDWSRPVNGDGEGWTARDLLAHLSSTQAAMAAVIAAPPAPTAGDGERPPFDPDRWNASQLRRRGERRPAELADEMRRGAEQIHAALMQADLAGRTGAGNYAGRPLAEALERMIEHQRTHLADLGAVLAQR